MLAKKKVFEELLDTELVFKIWILLRGHGVRLPSHLQGEILFVHLGRHLAIPIPDLIFNSEGFSGTLSFDRTPFHCVVPWSAVVAMSTIDVLSQHATDTMIVQWPWKAELAKSAPPALAAEERRAGFKVLEGGKKDEE